VVIVKSRLEVYFLRVKEEKTSIRVSEEKTPGGQLFNRRVKGIVLRTKFKKGNQGGKPRDILNRIKRGINYWVSRKEKDGEQNRGG